MNKKIMVDMSATLIHHGHIRLLKKASKLGKVIVGLTTDDEIIDKKGYRPEIDFKHRKEILESIKYVDEVVSVPWVLDDSILEKHSIDLLVHGNDNSNLISSNKLKIFPRTNGVCSSKIRLNAMRAITEINNQKLMLTPGPAGVLYENIKYLKPLFGRGDDEFIKMSKKVNDWIKKVSGQDKLITMQGSATLGLEIAAHNFVSGKVLLISTGYYSDRLEKLLPKNCKLDICEYEKLDSVEENYDWILCAYTETSIAFKVDLQKIRDKADYLNAKLYVDATGSIGLEEKHELADVTAFSSCKGLFGLTGACFVGYKSYLTPKAMDSFYFNINTHSEKMITGPYHAISSLYGIIQKHKLFKLRVIKSKESILKKYKRFVRDDNQPLLCTYINKKIISNDSHTILYSPRSNLEGSVVCHLGEIFSDSINIDKRIEIKN